MSFFLNLLTVYLAKVALFVIRLVSGRAGSTWPGQIALSFNKHFIRDLFKKNKHVKILLIAGTNGKTTTAKLIKYLLEVSSKKTVIDNREGANLLNGIASSLIKNINWQGKLKADVAIFEVDENALPLILEEIEPYALLILNLFRDQLDRYGEVNTILRKWKSALLMISPETLVFLNGDDPQLYYLGTLLKSKNYFFGIPKKYMEKKSIPHDVDFIYCPRCFSKLTFRKISYSHLGDFYCQKCKFESENVEKFEDGKLFYPMAGKYNIYNTNAALLVVSRAFALDVTTASKIISGFTPAFGRQEKIIYKGRNIIILLSKNPTGFNQSIETLAEFKIPKENVLVVLNDHIPDGRDVSWIWDVDFEKLLPYKKIFISGDRAFDLGLRFKYSNINSQPNFLIISDLEEAVNKSISQMKSGETLFILPTYSAMLEVRQILTGRKLI